MGADAHSHYDTRSTDALETVLSMCMVLFSYNAGFQMGCILAFVAIVQVQWCVGRGARADAHALSHAPAWQTFRHLSHMQRRACSSACSRPATQRVDVPCPNAVYVAGGVSRSWLGNLVCSSCHCIAVHACRWRGWWWMTCKSMLRLSKSRRACCCCCRSSSNSCCRSVFRGLSSVCLVVVAGWVCLHVYAANSRHHR